LNAPEIEILPYRLSDWREKAALKSRVLLLIHEELSTDAEMSGDSVSGVARASHA